MVFIDDFFLNIKKIHIAHEFVLDRVHRCEYPAGRGMYGLVYAIHGNAEYRFFTGERIKIADGDVIFLSPNAAYSIISEKGFKHYTVNFDIHEDMSRVGPMDKPYCLLRSVNTEQFKPSFKKLLKIWLSRKTGFEMQATGCLYEMLSLFYFNYLDDMNAGESHRLLPAREYIEKYFNQPISLENLAKISNMSITNFRREWKKRYKDTPIQYRDSIKIAYATELLNSGYYTVSEIAKKCGFEDVSYFVRFFKKNTGITPGLLKQSVIRQ